MTLQVFTAPIRYSMGQRENALDVTRKSGTNGLFLAPSWAILRPALQARQYAEKMRGRSLEKAARMSEESAWQGYERAYLEEMRASYRGNRVAWDALLAMERVVLCCYCPTSEKCHRGILRKTILPKLGAIDCGELLRIPSKTT